MTLFYPWARDGKPCPRNLLHSSFCRKCSCKGRRRWKPRRGSIHGKSPKWMDFNGKSMKIHENPIKIFKTCMILGLYSIIILISIVLCLIYGLIYFSIDQWIGVRENRNGKPWFFTIKLVGVSGFNFPIIQFFEYVFSKIWDDDST